MLDSHTQAEKDCPGQSQDEGRSKQADSGMYPTKKHNKHPQQKGRGREEGEDRERPGESLRSLRFDLESRVDFETSKVNEETDSED